MWKSLGEEITTYAPLLSSILQGRVEYIALSAGNLISFTLDVNPNPKDIIQLLQDKPRLKNKIKRLEKEKEDLLLKWQQQQIQAELKATKTVSSPSWYHSLGTYVVSSLVIIGFFFMIYIVIKTKVENEIAYLLLGALAAAFGQVVQYFVGSSKGSKDKDNLLAEMEMKKDKEYFGI